MSWTVPASSSPMAPSTPGSGQRHTNIFGHLSSGLPSNPSTTPAGPPPSSVGSFTPADPPPSSVFGSSQLGSRKSLFKSKSPPPASTGSGRSANPFAQSIESDKLARFLNKSGQFDLGDSNASSSKATFGMPSGHRVPEPASESEQEYSEEYSEDYEDEEDANGLGEESTMELDSTVESRQPEADLTLGSTFGNSLVNGNTRNNGSAVTNGTSRGVKRSRGGAMINHTSKRREGMPQEPEQESDIEKIVKDQASRSQVARLEEPDEFIVGTEDILIRELYDTQILSEEAHLPKTTEHLCTFWRTSRDRDASKTPPKPEVITGIGPDEDAPPWHKAIFVSTLLLQLHHPPTATGKQSLALARLDRLSTSATFPRELQIPYHPTALPKVLLDWLDKNHNHYEPTLSEVQRHDPSPTAHYNYWDIIFYVTLRGKLADLGRILKRSKFQHARTARDDGQGTEGYNNLQIKNIERVVNRAIQLLEYSPSLQDDNWNVTGNDWYMFRKRVEQAVEDLTIFAEGRDRAADESQSSFEASNFGLRRPNTDLSQSARRAESRVPWTIYQNLKTMYGILLGGNTEIISTAQDWVEATIGLTVWWDGDDVESVAGGSLALSRRSLRQPSSRVGRLVDENANAAYIQRLKYIFESVSNSMEENYQVDSTNQVQLALASVFQGNVDGVIGLLRGWSLSVTSAVAEIASTGGWFDGTGIMASFDEQDLMTISHGQQLHPLKVMTKDTILMEYAKVLSAREKIQAKQRGVSYEGWELSISVLNRLNDKGVARQRVSEVLRELPVFSDERMDKILSTCERFDILDEARSITEKYADHVVDSTDSYGTALIYYARAHRKKKVKDVLDLLISLSLVQSVAYPPISALDPNLHSLVFTPESSIIQLDSIDPTAAEMLHTHLTGYATLRKFYDLRDEEVNLEPGQKPRLRPIARKNAAATALLAVINSAADSIHGGLYDEDRGSIVQVDGLLALLGEAMVFVDQPKSIWSLRQCFAVLKAIEDLQTVTPRVYAQCEECFRAAIAAFEGRSAPAAPRELLKKSMSSMTSAGSFSLVGSSMLESRTTEGSSSRALLRPDEVKRRGWDWRKGLARDAKGEDVLRILRLGLAKDIARHWITDEAS